MSVIQAAAPVRVDLAGGTLDLWPLGLFEPGAVTVAAAIDLRVAATVASRARGTLIAARDLALQRPLDRAQRVRCDRLELLERCVRAFAPATPLTLSTHSPVRAGSGLGTSSALGVAIGAALLAFQRKRPEPKALVATIRDLEAQILGIPTGTQDHLAAWYGGLVILEHMPSGPLVRRVAGPRLRALGQRLLVVDSVQGRSSGPSNWDMFRRRVEGDPAARRALSRVAAAGRSAAGALLAADWRSLAKAMERDLAARIGWSDRVMTPQFEAIFDRARRSGALGCKVCGAGGGGFGVVLVDPSRRSQVSDAIQSAGGLPVSARPTATGLTIRRSPTRR
jgi:D-glycero-alpha-D-manno-heptose-7-phosphate kinase